MRRLLALLASLAFVVAAKPDSSGRAEASPALGVAIDLPTSNAPTRQAALEMVRRTGASFFVLELSWSAAEPQPRQYQLDEITSAARLLRQSGAVLHLVLPLVTESARDVPEDLADRAFDDPKLSLRLGRLLDALNPVLRDVQTLSLGEAADTYFADKPDELRAYRRLFDGAVQFLRKKYPRLLVGVTVSAPTESRSPEVAAALHRNSPALFYSYCPLVAAAPYTQRPPSALEKDWSALVKAAAGKPIAFPEVRYSSSAENGSSPEQQAEFIRRFRRFLAKSDGKAVLFARYLWLRDLPPEALAPIEPGASVAERRRRALLASCGLQDSSGRPKPAWRQWLRDSVDVKR